MQYSKTKLRELQNKALELPLLPGIYIMKNASGDIIYIGKAKKLKNRVSQYFRSIENHLPKVYQMVIHVDSFEHIVCDSEFEALLLECSLIKQHTPKYNILLKDDKGYHYVKISDSDYPKISSAKHSDYKTSKDKSKFIGPYMSAFAVKQMVEDTNKIFKLPTCNKVFPRDFNKARPCLQYHIGLCSGICKGNISKEEYNSTIDDAINYINGNGSLDTVSLTKQMHSAAEALDFELAARLRDRLKSAEKIRENQKIFISIKTPLDVISMSIGEQKCAICVLKYRKGRLSDSIQHIFDITDEYSEILSSFILQFYSDTEDIPKDIILNMKAADEILLKQLLSEKSGRKVNISVAQKNERYRLSLLAQTNAAEALSSVSKLSGKEIEALDELSRLLSLKKTPEYIESYDISNLGDKFIVGAMVVFENGRPLKSAYRKFTIKDQYIQDDYSAMRQVIHRRFSEYYAAEDKTSGFGRLPDLILLDGGKGHVSAVLPVLEELKIDVALFGMVKDNKHRTRAITGENEISIKSSRSAFTLVSKIQDEVHRYTISFQKQKHKNQTLSLTLTQVEGIGKAKATELLKKFKTIKAIKNASIDEISKVKGFSPALAEKLKKHLESI